jgi:cysteine desulfurase
MSASTPTRIYLDHNATTPVFPEVVEAMRACWSEPYLNPASQHEFGRRARRMLEDARDRIAELLGANTRDRVIFTSGGTESNNLAIHGFLPSPHVEHKVMQTLGQTSLSRLAISAIEHPSIVSLADQLAGIGTEIDRIAVDSSGIISRTDFARCIQSGTRVAAAMLANNETGVIQPIGELAAICNQSNVPLHVDGAQAAGKLAISFRELGAASMSIAAHKFGGPIGIGALIIRDGVSLQPQFFGGFQQGGVRPGTESVALAVGMCRALESWSENRTAWTDRMRNLRDDFENQIVADYRAAVVIGANAKRLPHVSNIAFVGLDRQQLFLALDQAGVACSTGSACASGSSEPSPVHLAMGLESGVISSALRFSFGVDSANADQAEAVRHIFNVCNALRR